MSETLLNIKNFSCGYGNKFRLNDINFSLQKGSFTGIIGPNGSGKTTLFKGITGNLKTDSGSIEINDKDIKDLSYKEKAQRIAIVTQKIEVTDITVEDYVLMGRLPYHNRFHIFETQEDFDIANKYIKLTKISHLKDKLISELSGGEQQLAGIARALTQEPDLLLLDEPTSHLDITHQIQVLNLILRLKNKLNLSVLMIIHDLNLSGEYCGDLILMNNGKIHTKGTSEEVLTYKHIEDVYKTVVVTQKNPISGKPAVFLVSEQQIEEVQKSTTKQ